MTKVYKNSTPLMELHGVPITMGDMVDACLVGRLNLFLQGDTGNGKTQLARDAMAYFGDKSMFVLGRNDMDTRELFQQLNPDFFKALKDGTFSRGTNPKELTNKINTHLIVVDELPNCVSAVRAQLFNLFDGFIELNGKPYSIGNGYSVGIATGNIGQRFTESSNELGRALRDRMHVTIDTDYFSPQPSDSLEILSANTNPRVEFGCDSEEQAQKIIDKNERLASEPVQLEKLLIANYLLHGLDYCTVGNSAMSKRKLKEQWPNVLDNHGTGSDESLVLPVSPRAAKSIIRLSQSLDALAKEKGGKVDSERGYFESMMQAYKFVGAYSGILNDVMVDSAYQGDKYSALDAIISASREQFNQKRDYIAAALTLARKGKLDEKVLAKFNGRWDFMKDTIRGLLKYEKQDNNS